MNEQRNSGDKEAKKKFQDRGKLQTVQTQKA